MDHVHEGEKRYITKVHFKKNKMIILKAIGCNIHFYLVMKTCIFFHKINQLKNF